MFAFDEEYGGSSETDGMLESAVDDALPSKGAGAGEAGLGPSMYGLDDPDETLALGGAKTYGTDPGGFQHERAALGHAGASILSSAFNLTNTIIGAGILALPYGFSLIGYGSGCILLLLCVLVATYSIGLLLEASKITGRRTYESIADRAFGRKGIIIVSVSVLILNFGVLTAYMIIIGDVLPELIEDVAGHDFLAEDWDRAWSVGVATMVILLPLSMLREVTMLAPSSFLSLACVLGFGLTVLVMVISGREKADADGKGKAKPFIWSVEMFRAFSLFAFAFTCHTNVFPIYLELKEATKPRMMKAVHGSMVFTFALYSAVAAAAYIDYSDTEEGVDGDVLNNLEKSERNAVSAAVRIAYAISIASTYPLAVPPIRQALTALFFEGQHPTKWSITRHITVVLVLISTSFVVSLYLPVLEFVFGLTGATSGVAMVYVLPPLFMIKLDTQPFTWRRRGFDVFLVVVGAMLGVCSTLFTILDYIEEGNGDD